MGFLFNNFLSKNNINETEISRHNYFDDTVNINTINDRKCYYYFQFFYNQEQKFNYSVVYIYNSSDNKDNILCSVAFYQKNTNNYDIIYFKIYEDNKKGMKFQRLFE